MNLTVLENQIRIELANDDFSRALIRSSVKFKEEKVLFKISDNKKIQKINEKAKIRILKDLGFWYSYIKKYDRLIYSFGVENHDEFNKPLLTIDFPSTGINKNASAVFAQDSSGQVYVLYRVNTKDLNLNSFELEYSGEWIKAMEGDKNKYFISLGKVNDKNLLNNLKDILEDLNRIKDSNLEIDDDTIEEDFFNGNESIESCVKCGNLISDKSDHDIAIQALGIESLDKCKDCVENIAAARALKEITDKINIKVFNKDSLLERTDKPDIFNSYLDLLKNKGFLKEISPGLFISTKNKDIDKFIKKYSEKSEPEIESGPIKKCLTCGVELTSENSFTPDSLSEDLPLKCKDCYRKNYAIKALKNLEKYVIPSVSFKKDHLLNQVENKTKFLDYIWTLQEFDLLKEEGNESYLLKPKEELIKFKEKYGDNVVKSTKEKVNQEKSIKKIVKECEICGEVQPISNFYKSPESPDGYTEKCKDCSRKSYGVKALLELKKYVIPNIAFYKDDLLKQADNKTQILDYFWTLQEFDLIDHQEKNDTYILKPEKDLHTFEKLYGDKFQEEAPEKDEEIVKTVKECNICRQTLPISDYYKSSESEDGFSERCKNCTDKLNAAKILTEIKEYIGVGNPFSKNELSKQLGNPTKVNYYIWILQEHDLINHDEKMDIYTLEESSKYKDYEDLIDQISGKTKILVETTEDQTKGKKEETDIKNIIYISESNETSKIVILRGLIQQDNLNSVLNEIKNVSINLINLNLNKKENLFNLIVELEIENSSFEKTINYFKEKNWNK